MKVLPIKLPDEMYKDLKTVSVADGLPMAEIIREYLGTNIKKKAKKIERESKRLQQPSAYTGPLYFNDLTDDEILYSKDPVKIQLRKLQKKIVPILKKYKVKKAGIFGSATRDDFSSESDVDLLYLSPNGTSLFDQFALKQELEKKLKRSVDLIEYDYIHPRIKTKVLRDAVTIL